MWFDFLRHIVLLELLGSPAQWVWGIGLYFLHFIVDGIVMSTVPPLAGHIVLSTMLKML
jgi:hypothetical protein